MWGHVVEGGVTVKRARIDFESNAVDSQGGTAILWSAFTSENSKTANRIISLPKLVAGNAALVREEILQTFEGFYETLKIACGESIFEIEEGLNYWRMGFTAANAMVEDSYLYDIARLIELFRVVEKEGITHLQLVSPDVRIAKILTQWSDASHVEITVLNAAGRASIAQGFQLKTMNRAGRIWALGGAARSLSSTLLRYGLKFKYSGSGTEGRGRDVWMGFLASYQKRPGSQVPDSGYWGDLPQALDSRNHCANWVFIDIRSTEGPTLSQKRADLRTATSSSRFNSYFLIQDFMTLRALRRILIVFFRLRRVGANVLSKDLLFPLDGGRCDAFPLLGLSWQSLWLGSSGMKNAIWIGLFEEFFQHFSPNRSFMTMENQGWERAFVHGAKRKNEAVVFGFAHSQVRFWDLRYFHCFRPSAGELWDQSSPDAIIVGSGNDRRLLTEGGAPAGIVINAEALRFCSSPIPELYLRLNPPENHPWPLSILFLGDYDDNYSRKQLDVAKKIADLLAERVNVTFRPHPASNQRIETHNNLLRTPFGARLDDSVKHSDLVICSHLSASGLHAEVCGKPVLRIQNPRYLCDENDVERIDILGFRLETRVDAELWLKAAWENSSRQIGSQLNLDGGLPKWLQLVFHSKISQSYGGRGD